MHRHQIVKCTTHETNRSKPLYTYVGDSLCTQPYPYLIRESIKVSSYLSPHARLVGFKPPYDVLKCSRTQEVFLLQTKLLSFHFLHPSTHTHTHKHKHKHRTWTCEKCMYTYMQQIFNLLFQFSGLGIQRCVPCSMCLFVYLPLTNVQYTSCYHVCVICTE